VKPKKYKGRKQYSQKEAEQHLETTFQMYYTVREHLFFLKAQGVDPLIQALCKQNTQEMIEESEMQAEYLYSKIQYLRQFAPEYTPKIG
jgi:hypothetical protein